jgi:hypothetical protein
VGAEFYHADGQTDIKNLVVAFRNFRSALKMTIFKKCNKWKCKYQGNNHLNTHTHTSLSDAPCSLTGGKQDRNTTGGTTRESNVVYKTLCTVHVLKCIPLADTGLATECYRICCLATSARNDARPSGWLPRLVTPSGTFSFSCYVMRSQDSLSPNTILGASSFFVLFTLTLLHNSEFFDLDFTRADWLENKYDKWSIVTNHER